MTSDVALRNPQHAHPTLPSLIRTPKAKIVPTVPGRSEDDPALLPENGQAVCQPSHRIPAWPHHRVPHPPANRLRAMTSTTRDLRATLAAAVNEYQEHGNIGELLHRLDHIAADATPDALIVAVEPYREIPEVAGPIYERIVEMEPDNARALVILANSYWLSGRGPEQVGELASRAIAADGNNRGAWHLWALTESAPRERMARWRQVTTRFPDDLLALANLADNAASVAGAESDPEALLDSIRSYELLLERTEDPEQRTAVENALLALRTWDL